MGEYDDIDRRLLEGKKPRQAGTALHRDTAELASTYDKTSVHHFEHGKKLISALNVASGECVLDIGAGTGRTFLQMLLELKLAHQIQFVVDVAINEIEGFFTSHVSSPHLDAVGESFEAGFALVPNAT